MASAIRADDPKPQEAEPPRPPVSLAISWAIGRKIWPVRVASGPAACSFWRKAEAGVFYASAAQHLNCPIGAMTMGAGAALMEDLVVDKRIERRRKHLVTVKVELRNQEVVNTGALLGEGTGEAQATPADAPAPPESPTPKNMKLTVPKLGLEDVAVPTGFRQEELDREGLLRMKESGLPWEEGSNTFIAGHALGYPQVINIAAQAGQNNDQEQRQPCQPDLAEHRLVRRLAVSAVGGRQRDHDLGHESHEQKRREAGPDAAPGASVTVDFGQHVADHVGDREEQDARPERPVADAGQRRVELIRSEDDFDVGGLRKRGLDRGSRRTLATDPVSART